MFSVRAAFFLFLALLSLSCRKESRGSMGTVPALVAMSNDREVVRVSMSQEFYHLYLGTEYPSNHAYTQYAVARRRLAGGSECLQRTRVAHGHTEFMRQEGHRAFLTIERKAGMAQPPLVWEFTSQQGRSIPLQVPESDPIFTLPDCP